jgi:multidrug resistance efflux pump
VIARLEDHEYRAQVQQAEGNLNNLKAKLLEQQHGSLPQEVSRSQSDVHWRRRNKHSISRE